MSPPLPLQESLYLVVPAFSYTSGRFEPFLPSEPLGTPYRCASPDPDVRLINSYLSAGDIAMVVEGNRVPRCWIFTPSEVDNYADWRLY